jgi:hypothetical protein
LAQKVAAEHPERASEVKSATQMLLLKVTGFAVSIVKLDEQPPKV